ncbi:MAG: sulfate adenylyltransferase [Minicystis sp.]
MSSGFIVWFTGLSGAGKSTLAAMLSAELRARGVHVEVLDGDEVRTHLSKGLGFSREDRDTNVRRIGFVAKLLARAGACAMTAAISPYRAVRDEQRAHTERFVEVFVTCAVPTLAERDPKGLYKKALAGEIKHFTGVDDPYEAPESPEVTVDTGRETKEESLGKILRTLEDLGYVAARGGAAVSASPASKLIAPHGGELVDLRVHGDQRERLAARAEGMSAIDLDARGEGDLALLASGAYSPLKGFMNEKDYLRVVREMRLENGLPWALPITLAVSEDEAAQLSIGAPAALRDRAGRRVAVIEISDLFRPDKEREAKEVFGTNDAAHSGVHALQASGSVYVGGEVQLLEVAAPRFPGQERDPRETRAHFAERGWSRVVGFQTRNPMHRGHEYLARTALELCDGLLIHPSLGPSGEGDLPAEVRLRCYEALLSHYFPRERVMLSFCPIGVRFAGPREALHHALVRKNYGCSHFIVGRDHAGIGAAKGAVDAPQVFATFAPGELGVELLFFDEAFHSSILDATATSRTAPGDEADRVAISGSEIRRLLARGEPLPATMFRPEVATVLLEATRPAR